ncbi:MAG: lysophospholipid acyltransferase family protein [Dehalococcoidia bacterium]|nr:lysophospholipid acyltransferase family protein [Dehalococcoidia bacterium]MDD5494406.1 lysophospholipid acyltransferase family protein [Dehalococcoidia bacterium]
MKASFLKTIQIIVASVAITLRYCFLVFYLRISRTYTREYADNILRLWSSFLLRTVDATTEVKNPHNVSIKPGVPHIIMSNHRGHYDIPLIFVSLPGSIRMLTKKELFKIPIFGQAMKDAEFVSIDRHNHAQALKDLDEARKSMESGIVLWVAPEGTRSGSERLGKFKKGGFVLALQTGAVIIPVGIKGSEKILKLGTWDFQIDQKIEVNIGEPIEASRYNIEQKDTLMQDVLVTIKRLTGVGS